VRRIEVPATAAPWRCANRFGFVAGYVTQPQFAAATRMRLDG
jgi:hypothetical protein